ncbi:hypothetical protein N7537_005584, partial [Penicillium hordei]
SVGNSDRSVYRYVPLLHEHPYAAGVMGTLKHWGDMENWFGEKEAWGLNEWMSKWEIGPQLLQLGARRDCRPAISDKVTGAGGTGKPSTRNINVYHSHDTGIGAATTKAFAAAGCTQIAITDLNEESLQQTAKVVTSTYPKVRLLVMAGDVADDQFSDAFINAVVQEFGRVDYAVNCAGVLSKPLRSAEMSLEEFDRVNNINYRGCWLSSRAELRQMVTQSGLPSHDSNRPPQRGAVVNVSSQLGIVSRPGAPAYCASKAAVIGMTRADAIDYSKDGIRVNCVCPGVIETPLVMEKPEVREAIMPAVETAPMKRMGQPAEVADAILFLCSTQASFVQGHAMVVDGGYITV